ncbi:hypothetical protein [Belnapia moabensis]|uniref:hypothetical protein n=1 Tax=Belnapia moabensis TaxID=365533 RepID=UPI0012ED3434|nr:hypothetical protein [Belnapia moabensis]
MSGSKIRPVYSVAMSNNVLPLPAKSPDDRLARALRHLNLALQQQREAVEDLRLALTDLDGAVGSLSHSLEAYSTPLQDLQTRVTAIHHQSLKTLSSMR